MKYRKDTTTLVQRQRPTSTGTKIIVVHRARSSNKERYTENTSREERTRHPFGERIAYVAS